MAAPRGKLEYPVYSPHQSVSSSGQYVIGVRDELDVAVWKCPELDITALVRPEDGCITMPLIGDVRADGLTPKELANAISKKMAYYVKDPRVAVGVRTIGDKKVIVMGEVPEQGMYKLQREDRIIELIARAGGFTGSAVPSCTYIVRGGYYDPEIVRVNLARLIYQGDVTQNVYLLEGDIVYVPMQGIDNLNAALQKIFPSIYFAEKLGDMKGRIMSNQFDFHEIWNKMGDKDYTR
ncbi:MAG: polysaccharide biosynthesis/export family protein [Candidatus Omnitrophota bacterium]|nr:polysaccharide biosynthesis/export family protein [Candidatus Omnitrophota bacterium]